MDRRLVHFRNTLYWMALAVGIPSLSNSESIEDLIAREPELVGDESVPSDHPYGNTPLERMVAFAHTTNLPICDKVEVITLRYRDPSKKRKRPTEAVTDEDRPKFLGAEVLATRELGQVDSRTLCKAWRNLDFDKWKSAFCHYPAYGIRFSSDGQVLYETSICWACSNVLVPDVSIEDDGFDFEENDDTATKPKWRPTIQTYGFNQDAKSDALLKLLQQILPHPQSIAITAGARASGQ